MRVAILLLEPPPTDDKDSLVENLRRGWVNLPEGGSRHLPLPPDGEKKFLEEDD